MRKRFFGLLALAALTLSATVAAAAPRLLMVEQPGCFYCSAWNETIGPIYPKTPEGKFAPLERAQLRDGAPKGVTFDRRVSFTPTFILVDEGRELARIEGYPGEDFFWGLLTMILEQNTDFTTPAPAQTHVD